MTEEQRLTLEFLEQDTRVEIEKDVKVPPAAITYGEKLISTEQGDRLVPITLATYGNISYVTAPPKTRKTFFVSLLASVYLSGQNTYGGDLAGLRADGKLLHIDTEQGEFHAQMVFKRPLQMDSGLAIDKYKTYALRTLDYKTRIDLIDFLIDGLDAPSLVIIDGIADLCSDVNNIIEANALVQKLMRWSASKNCHIISVIHQNFGSNKFGTGHLGSFLEKKAETVLSLEANTVNVEWTTVKCGRSRGFPFDTFSFKVNDNGLPQIVKPIYDPLK